MFANAGKGSWQHIDHTRIGVWGQSCGGLEAYSAGAHDDRVSHLGIFNSGQLAANSSKEVAGSIAKPIFYILGGPGDVAYPNVYLLSFQCHYGKTDKVFTGRTGLWIPLEYDGCVEGKSHAWS